MVPLSVVQNYKKITYPTNTYAIDWNSGRIKGYVDEQEAMKQAIYKVLNTERFEYLIYNGNYGIKLKDLFGRDKYIACAVLERRIKNTLLIDDRIRDAYDFDFSVGKNSVLVKFTLYTIYGKTTEEVSINV